MIFENIVNAVRAELSEKSTIRRRAEGEIDPMKDSDNPIKKAVDKTREAKKNPTRKNISQARASGWKAMRYARDSGYDKIRDQLRKAMNDFPSPVKADKIPPKKK